MLIGDRDTFFPGMITDVMTDLSDRMLIGNRDTFFPDMITDVITDVSDHPIRCETLVTVGGLLFVKSF